ncbi:MAG TPA: NAD(P)-dependent oxidoreductase [Bacteroidales bacterium]|nr:NAD(P)-dependent oxidoreductase [Bacteroidales bacterium]
MEIVFLEPLSVSQESIEKIKADFEKNAHTLRYYTTRTENENELAERTGNADIAVLSNIKVSEKYFSKCKNLKFLQVAFTGFDHVDLEYCKKHNISVSNAAGYATTAVTEITLSLALSLLRNTNKMENNLKTLKDRNGFLGEELAGKTLGIIGTGAIGMAVAKLFLAFGCRVLAYSRTQKNFVSIEYTSLETLLEQSDIISLHVPYTPETHHLINEETLNKCKKSALLINTARGLVVDSKALAKALNENKLAGAGLDVFEQEPPIPENHPLLSAKNTILLPHIAYATKQSMEKRLEIVYDSINLWIDGKQINKVV